MVYPHTDIAIHCIDLWIFPHFFCVIFHKKIFRRILIAMIKRLKLMPLTEHQRYFITNGERVSIKKGHVFARKEETHPWVYYLEKGIVQVTFSYGIGNDRLIGYFVPDMMFAQSKIFYEGDSGVLEYSSLTDIQALRIRRNDYMKMVESNHDFCSEYRECLLHNQTYMIDRVVYQAEPNVEKKFLRWVLFMIKYYGVDTDGIPTIGLKLTQETIADFLFVSRETINKTLIHFIKEGIVGVEKKHIMLHDEAALRAHL